MKRAMSLITIIITIIVMIIIAGVAVVGVSENNPLLFASEAAFKSDIRILQEKVNVEIANLALQSDGKNIEKTGELYEFLKDKILLKRYKNFFVVIDGECIVSAEAYAAPKYDKYVEWAESIGFKTMADISGTIMYDGFDGTVNRPNTVKGMIPVIYSEVDEKWHVAEPGNISQPYWYDYKNQKWANTVTVFDEKLRDNILATDGKSIKKEAVGTVIELEQINAMWVWIPRYSYKITEKVGTGNLAVGKIDINFTKDLTLDEDESYINHPAFKFDEKELYGIWVSKFQAGTLEKESTLTLDKRQIFYRPEMTAVTDQKLVDVFNKCRLMESSDIEGWNIDKDYNSTTGEFMTDYNNMNVHLTKGTEYGAVAYLATSKYGKTGNSMYGDAEKEVYPNISGGVYSTGFTGRSSGAASSIKGEYKYIIAKLGTGASTTGNIYGVYDMAGRRRNILMSNHGNLVGESGFSVMPDKKYYDFVKTKGDATIETDGWYGDNVGRFDSYTDDRKNTWRVTGMIYDYSTYKTAGMFSYDAVNGAKSGYYYEKWSFRPTIVPIPLV